MKTVLIPTDFKLADLRTIDALILNQPAETFKIVFVHAFKLSDSITDLLMLSRRSRDYQHISDEFYAQLEQYKQRFKNELQGVGIEYFYGSTAAAFRNFIENLAVDCIAFPKNYAFKPINKYSIDPQSLIKHGHCERLSLDTDHIPVSENLFDTKIPAQNVPVLTA
jgi:hypothetical protein